MNLGDQNNAFFHNQMKVRQARNAITYLVDDTGRRVEDLYNISQLVVDFCGCITSFFYNTFTFTFSCGWFQYNILF